MKSTDTIRVELEDGLAVLSLAQPARVNQSAAPSERDQAVASELLNCDGLRAAPTLTHTPT
jgi:2-(1,2-epoxy-1,2-dihydrophenyl)acetyl-CoA isomerase